ncbi:MAG: hypothetical protein ACR2QM_01765 [Longimicrobiales bacterium]
MAALLLVVACDDVPMAPVDVDLGADEAPVQADQAVPLSTPTFSLTTSDGQSGLRWSSSVKKDERRKSKIDEQGGVIWTNAGVYLDIPENALSKREEITVVAAKGKDVAFVFGPHGLHFQEAVTVRIKLIRLENRTDILEAAAAAIESGAAADENRVLLGSLTAVYYADQDGELIEVIETFPIYLVDGEYLEFETDHFSGYALAW